MMNASFFKKKVKAYSLQEMLIALAIAGILILIAVPIFLPLMNKAKSLEAKEHLGFLHTLEKTYHFEHSKYSNDLAAIGFEQEKLSTEGDNGKANYRIEILEAGTTTYHARATSVVDFDGDGKFNVWEIDQDKNLKEVEPD